MNGGKRLSVVVDNRRRSIHAWQDQIRDPSLTILLVLELCTIFVAAPLAAKGLPMARTVANTFVLAVLVIVVMLSRKWGEIVVILLGLAATMASFLPTGEWSPLSDTMARHGGEILTFSALIWVVAHAVYAPGRITFHRLQGAIVLYLSLAIIFAATYSLIWELIPGAFVNIAVPTGDPREVAVNAVFQPQHADDHRLWGHRPGRSVRTELRQSGGGCRAIFSCHYRRPACEHGTGRPPTITSPKIDTMPTAAALSPSWRRSAAAFISAISSGVGSRPSVGGIAPLGLSAG